jgi:shikimate kinase
MPGVFVSISEPRHGPPARTPGPGHKIVLVGMMGAGKTSVGKALAQRLDVAFVDTDSEIEARAGCTVRDLFSDRGEPYFRDLEAEVLRDVLAETAPAVVACGGGVVTQAPNRAALVNAPGARVVWLRARPETLTGRTRQQPHRPLLDDDPLTSLRRLDAQRAAWYAEVADDVIDVDDVTTVRVVRHLLDLIDLIDHGGHAAPVDTARS